MNLTEITTEDELRAAAQEPPETLEELEAHYAPGHYSTLLY